jgi:integrase
LWQSKFKEALTVSTETSVYRVEYLDSLAERLGQPTSSPQGVQVAGEAIHNVSSNINLTNFVAIKFLPEYVQKRSIGGRRHYQAMLKYILRPETVDQIFQSSVSRMRAIPGWPYLDEVKLCDLREQHVREITRTANARGYSAQTVKHIRGVLGVIIDHAKREGLFADENPVAHVEIPPTFRKRPPQPLTIAQAKAMLGMMQFPDREIALIAITTGMSIQEICGLQWKNVNLTKSAVECDGKVIPPNNILVRQHWYPDGIFSLHSNRVRVIEIPHPVAAALTRLKQDTKPINANSFVVAVPSGEPIRPAGLGKLRLIAIGRKIAMPSLSWRHINRAHSAMLIELRTQLSADLVSSAR